MIDQHFLFQGDQWMFDLGIQGTAGNSRTRPPALVSVCDRRDDKEQDGDSEDAHGGASLPGTRRRFCSDGPQNLHRDLAIVLQVLGEADRGHTPSADLFLDCVAVR